MLYIEDYLHYYVEDIGIHNKNKAILESINTQCRKGVALTDRQYDLIRKLMLEHNLEGFTGDEPVKLPLRQIDRSKYIKIVSHLEMMGQDTVYESYKQDWVWLKVRFPFSKKLIAKLDLLKNKIKYGNTNYFHRKGSHEHYFRAVNDTVYHVVDSLANSNFEIDDSVIDFYNKSKEIIENKTAHIPLYHNGFFNVGDNVKQKLVGNTELQIADKSIRYQYTINNKTSDKLVEKIAYRNEQSIAINPADYSLEDIAQAFKELNRFPVLALIDQNSFLEQVQKIHEAFDFVPNNLQSVLFRDESKDRYNVNDYIKEHKLNNWVDNNTQIVYIKKTQLPKVLFDSGFEPITTLGLNSYRSNNIVSTYYKFRCDLILFHDTTTSLFETRGYFI